jgi:molybdopterin synthase sulfur carrier subunit
MEIEVRLFAVFREGRFKNKRLEFAEEFQLNNLLRYLKISPKEVGVVLVNGRVASSEAKLATNDVVSIFPSLGGG